MDSTLNLNQLKEYYQNELSSLIAILAPYEAMWSREIIGNYPKNLDAYPKEWVLAMGALSEKQMWQLDCSNDVLTDNSSLNKLLGDLRAVSRVDKLPYSKSERKYPSWAMQHVSGKKQHEISCLVDLLENMNKLRPGQKLIEIGGGKAHLGRILSLYHGINTTSIDTNLEFQKLGQKRLEKYPLPEGHGRLQFLHHTFGDSENQHIENKIFDESDLSLGLHTCGPLAAAHLSYSKTGKTLVNIGCCYQKCKKPSDINLSNFCRNQQSLNLGKYALTLATRGHTVIDKEEFDLKKRVKYYRAALQLFINQKLDQSEFISVGSSHPRDYKLDFSHYAKEKLSKHLPKLSFSSVELNDYFESIQKDLDLIFWANLIRWRFGRALEKYIVFDRALDLVEKGHLARCFEIFDQAKSPRNIAIIVE